MLLSIVILNYKSKSFTRECVKGILQYPLPFDYEIIIVDNGSNDGVCQMAREKFVQPNIKCVENQKNLGMGAGNNVGFRAARGKYLMVLNPDTVIFENSIAPLIDFLEKNPQAGIAAPRVLNPDKSYQPTVHRFPSFWMPLWRRTPLGHTRRGQQYLSEYTVSQEQLRSARRVDWVFGPAFVIRKSLADQLGGYDERYFLTFEDTDLAREVYQAGWQVYYVPEAQIVHYPHRVTGHSLGLRSLFRKTTWYHISSWLKYFWKWHGLGQPRT